MPTYEYVCDVCRTRMEVVHGIHAGPPEVCPNCGAVGSLRKAFAPPTIHFKGSGWAKKDRASAARSSKPAASADSSGDGGSSKDGASDGQAAKGDKGEKGDKGDKAPTDKPKSEQGSSPTTGAGAD